MPHLLHPDCFAVLAEKATAPLALPEYKARRAPHRCCGQHPLPCQLSHVWPSAGLQRVSGKRAQPAGARRGRAACAGYRMVRGRRSQQLGIKQRQRGARRERRHRVEPPLHSGLHSRCCSSSDDGEETVAFSRHAGRGSERTGRNCCVAVVLFNCPAACLLLPVAPYGRLCAASAAWRGPTVVHATIRCYYAGAFRLLFSSLKYSRIAG